MRSYRLLQSLFAMIFAVISLSMASPAAACCGEAPNWFVTAFVENQPFCTNRAGNGGSVTWGADYHLFSGQSNHIHVHVFADSVITNNSNVALPHVPGADVDTIVRTATWQWKPEYTGTTTTVRVQIDAGGPNDFEDGAMIRITCQLGKVISWEIENWEGHYIDY